MPTANAKKCRTHLGVCEIEGSHGTVPWAGEKRGLTLLWPVRGKLRRPEKRQRSLTINELLSFPLDVSLLSWW